MTDRPNFLLILTDQHRADHLGYAGHATLRTPAIDSLADRGIVFDRAYVTSPICMPNRAALATGRMPSVCGVRHNGVPLPLEAVTFADQLRVAGYRTALVGKAHLQTQSAREVPDPRMFPRADRSDARASALRRDAGDTAYLAERIELWARDPAREPRLPYYGFDDVALACGHGDQVEGHYTRWLRARRPDWQRLRGPEHALPGAPRRAPQAWRTALPPEVHPTAFVADETIRCLEAYATDAAHTPFLLQCSFPDPHHPFTPPGRYWDLYDPADVELPRSFGAQPDEPRVLRDLRRLNADPAYARGPFCTQTIAADAVRDALALTYGMIACIDDAIGRVLATLARLGLDERTVVIFTSDHGDLLGDRGLVFKQALHYEGLIRVPLVWRDPSRAPARTDALASTLDLAPTILARAGVPIPWGVQGEDLLAVHEGHAPRRSGLLVEEEDLPIHMGALGSQRLWSYVTDRWRLTLWQDAPDGELFDRREDPDELRNLWHEPGARQHRAALTEALLRERMRLTDPLPTAERSA